MNDTERDELLELANGYVEQSLNADQVATLEAWLARDEEARRCFVDFTHDHATLFWEQVSPEASEIENLADFRPRRLPTLWQTMAAAAVISLLALALIKPQPASTTFATMASTAAARWESGTLPTMDGARLGKGSLKLVRGLATIHFDSGAEVILEAPAELELIDPMNCRLVMGTAVAEVTEGAEGFTISTPTANVIDYGTRFAVNVNPETGGTQTQVFDGLVEVQLPGSGESIELRGGQRNFVAGQGLGAVSDGLEEATWSAAPPHRPRDGNWKSITTADGNGEDGDVYGQLTDHVSDELLLLKNSSDSRGPHRKSYLRFDLSGFEPGSLQNAELSLRFVATGWGLASHLDDAVFQVYGITDDGLDVWSHETLNWENAPANEITDGTSLLPGKAIPLGQFELPKGIQSGTFGIRGEKLTSFLNADKNRKATLVVVRLTKENRGGGLVHAFASARHPNLPAPTLTVKTK